MTQGGPSKEELIRAYDWLDKESHPHNLLPLETRLPDELKWKSRDEYRIIMSMILSGAVSDKRLSKCLGTLFRKHPDFGSFRNIEKFQIKQLLGAEEGGGIGLGYTDPDGVGNGARLWSFLSCYFGPWKEKITRENIKELYQERGFNFAFVRKIEAYYLGDTYVLPLDKPAFRALCNTPLYEDAYSSDEVRKDIENKLRGVKGVSLIDFHEMLRFIEQYTGKSKKKQDDIVVGWNAWRLLCSRDRESITKDYKWIHKNLIKESEELAQELWHFFREIADPW